MNCLKFSKNWNSKLDCKAFSTIRMYDGTALKVNSVIEIMLNGKLVKHAAVKYLEVIPIDAIDTRTAFIDTGLSAVECIDLLRSIYSVPANLNVSVVVYTLVTVTV